MLALLLSIFSPLCLGQAGTPIVYRMMEEGPPDMFVGNLTRDSKLEDQYTPSQIGEMVFTFSAQTGEYSDYFKLSPTIGDYPN